MNQPVDLLGGASAFIDDYFRWSVGQTAAENLRKIQDEDIPRIKGWARENGSEFAAKKTELIHFTRREREQRIGSITMYGKPNEPQTAIKVLGAIFDQEL